MKSLIFKIIVAVTFYTATICFYSQDTYGQESESENKEKVIAKDPKNYLGTSVFILSSLIPNDNTYFYSIDYGRKLNAKNDLVLGANIYQYTAPMSAPWTDTTKYPGYVLSYGVVFAYQRYLWKGLFIDQMINPLFLNYHNENKTKVKTGGMLLCATRIGYHFDFTMFNQPFFAEVGVEISYWPYNGNVPKDFKTVDNKYNSYAPSPVLQFGYRF